MDSPAPDYLSPDNKESGTSGHPTQKQITSIRDLAASVVERRVLESEDRFRTPSIAFLRCVVVYAEKSHKKVELTQDEWAALLSAMEPAKVALDAFFAAQNAGEIAVIEAKVVYGLKKYNWRPQFLDWARNQGLAERKASTSEASSTPRAPEKADQVGPLFQPSDSHRVVSWPTSQIKPHPKNIQIFGRPQDEPHYAELRESIRQLGIQEPLIGVMMGGILLLLSGHSRLCVAQELGIEEVPVRIHPGFPSEKEELEYLVEANTLRRQLTPEQIGRAYAALVALTPEEGGLKRKKGRPKTGEVVEPGRTRDDVAKKLGVGRSTAQSLATVFASDSVPVEVQRAVREKKIPAVKAASWIREERGVQGGTLRDPTPLLKKLEVVPVERLLHEKLAAQAEALNRSLRQLQADDEAACWPILEDIVNKITAHLRRNEAGVQS